jgi:hypothetical protein
MGPLRLMLYDRTCWGGRPPGLTGAWLAGGWLYRALGRLDVFRGIAGWEEGLQWLATVAPGRPIAELQYWGHGNWGLVRAGRQRLDVRALEPTHPLNPLLVQVRDRLLPEGRSLWWFRTCETFGTDAGHTFAREWSRFFDCRVAGHTHVIGPWQSGLHLLEPGQEPHWPQDEGLPPGVPRPARARWSTRRGPNTVSFLSGRIPDAFGQDRG